MLVRLQREGYGGGAGWRWRGGQRWFKRARVGRDKEQGEVAKCNMV